MSRVLLTSEDLNFDANDGSYASLFGRSNEDFEATIIPKLENAEVEFNKIMDELKENLSDPKLPLKVLVDKVEENETLKELEEQAIFVLCVSLVNKLRLSTAIVVDDLDTPAQPLPLAFEAYKKLSKTQVIIGCFG